MHVHLVASDNGVAGVPKYGREMHHNNQMVKMQDQNEIFSLMVAFEVDKSPEVDE